MVLSNMKFLIICIPCTYPTFWTLPEEGVSSAFENDNGLKTKDNLENTNNP